MSRKIHLPGMGEVQVEPSQDTQLLASTTVQATNNLLQALQALSSQVEVLIRLECGVIKRADLKAQIIAREESMREQVEAMTASEGTVENG